jgi:hypothetical protein
VGSEPKQIGTREHQPYRYGTGLPSSIHFFSELDEVCQCYEIAGVIRDRITGTKSPEQREGPFTGAGNLIGLLPRIKRQNFSNAANACAI